MSKEGREISPGTHCQQTRPSVTELEVQIFSDGSSMLCNCRMPSAQLDAHQVIEALGATATKDRDKKCQ